LRVRRVGADVELFPAQVSRIDLMLSESKCEVITRDVTTTESMKLFTRVAPDESSLLGAPLNTTQGEP
jgi:hypothetical protein